MNEPGRGQSRDTVSLWGLPLLAVVSGAGIGTVSMASEPILRDGVPALSIPGGAAFIAIHMIVAALWLVPWGVGEALGRRLDGRWRFAGAAFTGVAFGVFSYFVGVDAVSGAWASTQWWAGYVPFLIAFGGGLGSGAFVWMVSRWRHWVVPIIAAAGALGCVAVDVLAFPGSYLFLHLGARVAAVGVAVATFASLRLMVSKPSPRWLSVVGGAVLLVAIGIWFAGPRSATKSMLLRRGPAATLASKLSPSTARSFGNAELVGKPSPDQSPALPPEPLANRTVDNVLLFYVDTLRFDAIPPSRPEDGTRFAKAEDTPFLNSYLKTCHTFRRAFAPSSATHKSIPSTFRSRESWSIDGYPLGLVLDEREITPAATVLNYFDYTKHTASTHLLDGFENVRVYDSFRQSDVVPKTLAMLDDVRNERFFAWVHFFAVHRPGWDGELISTTKVEHPVRYRRSLAWLDKTLGRLVTEMQLRGLADSTAIVLASDHGEGIGDHDVGTHGPTVFDTEIRVPLAICLPDGEGRVWDTTVGNIDLIPTLLDLLGTEPDPTHLGHSLGGMLIDDEPRNERSYYFENWSGTRRGVWYGDKKLMFAPRQSIFFLYDHSTDPNELSDVFDDATHADYTRLLFEHNPTLMKGAAESEEVELSVVKRLEGVDAANPPPDIDYLLNLGALVGSGPIETQAERLIRDTPHLWLRARVFDAFRNDEMPGEVLADLHDRGEVTAPLVKAAARHKINLKQFPKMEPFIMEMDPGVSPELRTSWVELANHVQKSGPEWERWLTQRLNEVAGARTNYDDMRRNFLVANVATTSWTDPERAADILEKRYLDDPDVNVQRTAIRSLSKVGSDRNVARLLAIAGDTKRDHVVRRAAIRAIGELGDATNGPRLMKAVEKDLFLSKHAAFALAELGDEASAKKLIKRHPRIADDARKALKRASEGE